MNNTSFEPKTIEESFKKNFAEYIDVFLNFQSTFLSNLNTRYKNLDNAHLVLLFGRRAHETILRKRKFDLEHDISLDNFWKNIESISQEKISIIQISDSTGLPKETARRKVLELIKNKILTRKNKIITWSPNDEYIKTYRGIVETQIHDLSIVLKYVGNFFNLNLELENIKKIISKNFSFFWFHFLEIENQYLTLWTKHFKDIEVFLIGVNIALMLSQKTKLENKSFDDMYNNPENTLNHKDNDISATSISEITNIPRATVIRKLNHLVKLKLFKQNKITKRYYVTPEFFLSSEIRNNTEKKVFALFSNFYSICLRALNSEIKKQF
jgi:predicted transcriptional regulator/DNA-binding Lrp family transcriptional regulator